MGYIDDATGRPVYKYPIIEDKDVRNTLFL